MPFVKYGMTWADTLDALRVELWMIRQSKEWLALRGRTHFDHYKAAQQLMWPDDDHHRWSDQALHSMIDHEISIFMGCGASNKTYSMSRYLLTDWWAFPEETLWLISSTEYRGAELRIWGKVKELFNRAREKFPWLPGYPLESMKAITTQTIEDDVDIMKAARSLQRGLIVVPNKKGNVNVGLSPFVGVRVPRLRHAGDEVQMMTSGFLDAYSNWYGNSDFRGVMAGNPLDITDQLCMAAEPVEGWNSFEDTGKTQEWKAKFFGAHVIAFDGRDSPNFDYPDAETKPRFPYMIGPKKLKGIETTHGKDSWQWFSQCVGKPNKGLLLWRVITSAMCDKNFAFNQAVWRDGATTKIFALDPAYGGGDRCVCGQVEFGMDVDGLVILKVHPPEIVPIRLTMKEEPEEQIARHVRMRLTELKIPVENAFYDSFGKGTLGFYFAQVFGQSTPIPVDSGSQPTDRPVRFDLYVKEQNGQRRLKRCDEHYSKFISEMWFSCAECIQSKQVRELPRNVMEEGCMRIYKIVGGNRHEVEPKDDMKERIGRSPDLFDWFAVAVEGARQRGFQISRIGRGVDDDKPSRFQWFEDLMKRRQSDRAKHQLNYQ